jgi:hypothetical protein
MELIKLSTYIVSSRLSRHSLVRAREILSFHAQADMTSEPPFWGSWSRSVFATVDIPVHSILDHNHLWVFHAPGHYCSRHSATAVNILPYPLPSGWTPMFSDSMSIIRSAPSCLLNLFTCYYVPPIQPRPKDPRPKAINSTARRRPQQWAALLETSRSSKLCSQSSKDH